MTYARFSDGRSALARDAEVVLGAAGVEIITAGTGERLLWPYDSLKAGEPVRTHAVDVLLTSSALPGASLFVPDAQFARELRQYAAHLTAHAERWRNARPWLLGMTALVALIALIYAAGWSPIRSIAGVLPETWRTRLGQQAMQSMTEGQRLCVSPDGVAALAKLNARLSQAAGSDSPAKISVYDWSLLNAFAVPGGQIVMTKGLIDKAESADEVAGVLAHEMGHGIELHPETGIIRAIGLAAAVELMMGGSGGTFANMGLLIAQLGYTRVAEHEADLQALRLLQNAKISTQGLSDFFQRVAEMEDENATSKALRQFDMLRSHPPTPERQKLVRDQAPYASTPALGAGDWQALKNICSATANPQDTSVTPLDAE